MYFNNNQHELLHSALKVKNKELNFNLCICVIQHKRIFTASTEVSSLLRASKGEHSRRFIKSLKEQF